MLMEFDFNKIHKKCHYFHPNILKIADLTDRTKEKKEESDLRKNWKILILVILAMRCLMNIIIILLLVMTQIMNG